MGILIMSINIIVQARMGSQRLPGKMMLDLFGQPIIYRILEKLRTCSLVDRVILAIPDTNMDLILAEVAQQIDGIDIVAGSESNLIERYQLACKRFPSEFVIRFPGDNVFPDPKQIDDLIGFHVEKNKKGFSSNLASVFDNKMIDGVGAEIFSSDLLMQINKVFATGPQTEHLHLNFYDYELKRNINPRIPVLAPMPPGILARPEYALDINTLEQYEFVRDIYKNVCMKNKDYSTIDIIKYLDNKGKHNA